MEELFFRKLKKAKAEIKLDAKKKETIRSNIIYFIEASEVGKETGVFGKAVSTPGIFWRFIKPTPIAVVILLVLAAGGGISLAAENSLPGDVLYPVKIFSEETRGFLIFTPEARADWEVKLTERRLEEMTRLAAKSRLSEAAAGELGNKFETAAGRAKTKIEEIQTTGKLQEASNAFARFEALLRANEKILNFLGEESFENNKRIKELQKRVGVVLENVGEAGEELELKIVSAAQENPGEKSVYENKLRDASNTVTAAHSFLERKKSGMNKNVINKT